MDGQYDEVFEALNKRAPSLASVLASHSVQLHVPEQWYAAAMEDLRKLLAASPEVMGATEVAEITGIARPNLYTTPGLPKPRQRLAMGSAWDAEEVRSAAAAAYHKYQRCGSTAAKRLFVSALH